MADFHYEEMFQLGDDPTEYRKLDVPGVSTIEVEGRELLKIEPEVLTNLAAEAIRDVSPDLGERCSDLVAHGVRDGHAWLAIEHVAGLGAHRTLTRAHADLLLDLAGAGSEPLSLIHI